MFRHGRLLGRVLASVLSGVGAIVTLVLLLAAAVLILGYGGRGYEHVAASHTGLTPDIRVRSAAHDRNVPELRRLLDTGASVDVPDSIGATALQDALGTRDPEVVALMAAHSRDINHVDQSGCTPLLLAVAMDEPELVAILLQHGANPSIGRVNGANVSEMARKQGSTLICAMIEEAAARTHAREPHPGLLATRRPRSDHR